MFAVLRQYRYLGFVQARVFLTFLVLSLPGLTSAQNNLAFDREQLEVTEDYSESLANALLDLSVVLRRKDWISASKYFIPGGPLVAEPFPSRRTLKWREHWISEYEWNLSNPSGTLLVPSLHSFLARFNTLDDVRLKVKGAEFLETSGKVRSHAKIHLFIVGRNNKHWREWVRGDVYATAVRHTDGTWYLTEWDFDWLSSMVAEKDLFSEVTSPAGLFEPIPPFGQAPNNGFVSHGVAVGDVNKDGHIDIVTSGVLGNRLHLNDGNGMFSDVSDQTFVGFSPESTGALLLDYDNDGDLDIFFAAVGNQTLLQNQLVPSGELHFLDYSSTAGVDHSAIGFSVAAADINNDGWTDIYVNSYNLYGRFMPNSWSQATNGTPNLLFVNKGDGTFREESKARGLDDSRWSYASAFFDVDGDGWQDLYVANDFGENALYMNLGTHFQDEASQRGVVDAGNGMGISLGDYDNDGDLDLHVTNMSSIAGTRILGRLIPESSANGAILKKIAAGNSLFENAGDGTFENVAQELGPFRAGWAWGGGFIDFDNDGREDLFTPNGFISGTSMKDT